MHDHLIMPAFIGAFGICVFPLLLLSVQRAIAWCIIGIAATIIGAAQFWLQLSVFSVEQALLRSVISALIPVLCGYVMYVVCRRAKHS